MNVILLEKVGKLGSVGDVANVKAGFARNYLFPSGIAVPANKKNLEEFEHRRDDLMAAHNARLATAQARAGKLNGMVLTLEVNASDEGRLFGSVGTKDIADAVKAAGGDIAKSEVLMPRGVIREVGSYAISLSVGSDVQASISVNVVSSKAPAGAVAETTENDGQDAE